MPPTKSIQITKSARILNFAGLLIFLLALAVRLIYLVQIQSSPFFAAPEMDQRMHDLWAQQIASGIYDSHGSYFRAPLYYYFLALIYMVFGHNYFIPHLIQFVLGALSAWMIYSLGRRLYSEKAGILAGVLYALCGPIIFHEGELLVEALLLPLLLVALMQLERQRKAPSYRGFLIAGLLLGLAAITRPNILTFVPLVWIWIFWVIKGRWQWILTFTAGLALIILPVTLHNAIVGKDFVLIASQSGVNFYIGNNPQSDGYTAIVPGTPKDWEGGYNATIRIAEEAAGRKLKTSEVSNYWRDRALREMSAHPGHWLLLTLRKVRLLFSGYEIGNNEDLYFQSHFSSLFALLMWNKGIAFPFGLLVPLGFLGLALTFNWRRDALLIFYLVAYSASVVAFFVCTRYRLPLIPVFILWTSVALVNIPEIIRSGKWKAYKAVLIVSLVLLIILNLNPLAGRVVSNLEGFFFLGNKYMALKQYPQALEAYQEALKLNPTSAPATNGVSLALLQLGRNDEAQKMVEKTLLLEPTLLQARNNLACLLQQEKEWAGAEKQYRAVLELDSSNAYAHRGLADVVLEIGNYHLAEQYYERAYNLGTADRQLISCWAKALLQQKKFAQALQVNRKLLVLEPDDARAHHNQARLYMACDSLDQAQKELEIVLRLAPGTEEAQRQLEIIRNQKGGSPGRE